MGRACRSGSRASRSLSPPRSARHRTRRPRPCGDSNVAGLCLGTDRAGSLIPSGMTEPARTSGKWYLLVLIPLAIAGIAGYVSFSGMFEDIEKMKRVVMPGEADLELAAG